MTDTPAASPLSTAVDSDSANPPETDGPSPCTVIEIELADSARRRFRRNNLIVGFLAYVVFIVAGTSAALFSMSTWPQLRGNPLAFVVIGIVVGNVAASLFRKAVWWWPSRRATRAAVGAVHDAPGGADSIRAMLASELEHVRCIHPETFFIVAAALLRARFDGRVVLLIRHMQSPLRARPIDVPFEPLELDDAEPRFTELAEPLAGEDGRKAVRLRGPRWARRVVRNLTLRGYWIYALLLLFFLADDLIDVFRHGRFSVNLSLGIVFLYLYVFRPHTRSDRGNTWLALPGGLLARGATLTLFRPDDCILALYQRSFGQWLALTGDGEKHDSRTQTQAESAILLGAWLSPIPAPPLEQLSDFTP